MPRFLHIADLHLGYEHRYLGDRAAERAAEAPQTLERIVEWVLDPKSDIAAVLIAGDLFETHDPDSHLVGQVIASLEKLTSAGKTLITVPGNHDEYSYPECVYRQHSDRWPGVLVTTPLPDLVAGFDLDKTRCHVHSMALTAGLSPKVLPRLDVSTSTNTDVHIALLHGTLDANPTDRSYRIDTRTLSESRIAYAALGHIHKPLETRIGDGWAVYPGTLNGKGYDDPGVDYLVTVSFPGGTPTIEHVPFDTRRITTRQIDLSRYDSLEKLISELETQADPELILRLELLGPRPEGFDAGHLRGRISSRFFHLEIDDLSVEIAEEEIDSLEHQSTVKGLFVQLMRRQMAEATAAEDEARLRRLRLALRKGIATFEGMRPSSVER
jgi:DNA repair exonuclease SbcCD nuclease subunit